jgi:GNAT superfamily N-acetyltransferase
MLEPSTKTLNATLLALLAAGVACGGSNPAQPSVPSAASTNVIRFDDPDGRLRSQQAAIREMLTTTLARVTQALPLDGVTISVSADASRAIGGYGVGGFTPDGRTVQLHVDPAFPEIAQLLPSRLPPMLAHELHHAKRWRGPGYGRTLLEAMVSEGLADRFSIELLGAAVPPWSDAFARDETALYLDLARPELDSTSYSHERWFFVRSATLPRWTGYTLGYRLVEAYQTEHSGATAAQLVNTPASAFRPE